MFRIGICAVHETAIEYDAPGEARRSIVEHDDIDLVAMQHRDEIRRHRDPGLEARAGTGIARTRQEHRYVKIAVPVAAPLGVAAEEPGRLNAGLFEMDSTSSVMFTLGLDIDGGDAQANHQRWRYL